MIYKDPTQSFCVLGGRFEPTTPMNDLLRAWETAKVDFINLPTLGFLLPFAAGYLIYTARRSLWLLAFSMLAGFFGLYAVHATDCQWMHYYTMTFSGLFLCLAVGLDSMRPVFRDRGSRWPSIRSFGAGRRPAGGRLAAARRRAPFVRDATRPPTQLRIGPRLPSRDQ